jgi:cellulose 1,4-beta-cellobiosidase
MASGQTTASRARRIALFVLAVLTLVFTLPAAFSQHVTNPYVGAQVYVNPDYANEVATAVTTEPAGSTLAQQMSVVGNTPTFVWLDHIGAIYGGAAGNGRMSLAQHIAAAAAQANGAEIVVQLVIYDLPDRDCAALASNGELSIAGGDTVIGPTGAKETLTGTGLDEYETDYITPIAKALAAAPSNIRFVLVIEDDSLPNMITNTGLSFSLTNCIAANDGMTGSPSLNGVYVQGIQYALEQFHALPNVYNYLDVGHHGWLGWPANSTIAFPFFVSVAKGTTAGVASVDGFITNTANYGPTKEPFLTAFTEPGGAIGSGTLCASPEACSGTFYQFNPEIDEEDYAAEFDAGLINAGFPSTLGFLIDTSRNGWGGSLRPTAQSTSTVLDTFVDESKIDERDDMGQWCNQANQGIGSFPTVNPGGFANLSAYVWVKPPGESDGDYPNGDTNAQHLALGATHGDENCDPAHGNTLANGMAVNSIPNSPPAGDFWITEFLEDVQNAFPTIQIGNGFFLTTTAASPVQGTTATSSVIVTDFGTFNGAVALSLSALPTGVTAAFNPVTVTGSAGSTLTFTVAATTVPGAYPLTVTGTGDSTTKTASLLLTVVPKPNFTITASSATVNLPVGTNPTDTFTIAFVGGLTGSVSVSATGAPNGMQINFAPNSVNAPGGTIVANFSVQSSTPAASYPINIVGTNGTITNSVPITVIVPGTGQSQTITFATIPAQTVGTPLTLTATASSGLTVSFASTTTTICTVSGTTATFLAAGTCSITASQAGNGTFAAATPVTQSFTVNTAGLKSQTITFATIPAQTVGTPLTLTATASSGLTVSLASTTTTICTVSGTTATFLAAGTCSITASQAGNSTFAAATPVTQSFTVNPITTGNYCHVVYTIGNQWPGGFGAAVTLENTGTANWTSWTLTWTFANGQTITQLWNGAESQSGAIVTVSNLSYNGSIAAGGSYNGMGFNGSWSSTNAVPTAFAVNGHTCN